MPMLDPRDEIALIEAFSDTRGIGMADADVSAAIAAISPDLGNPVTDALTRSAAHLSEMALSVSPRLQPLPHLGSIMTAPRVAIDPGKIRRNTRFLVETLRTHGITVTGVTKAVCGHPGVALAMPDGGTIGLADARVVNVRRKRNAGLTCPISMIRGPLQREIEDVVQWCDSSCNTEIDTIQRLAVAAHKLGKTPDVLLMLEVGGVREGIPPKTTQPWTLRWSQRQVSRSRGSPRILPGWGMRRRKDALTATIRYLGGRPHLTLVWFFDERTVAGEGAPHTHVPGNAPR